MANPDQQLIPRPEEPSPDRNDILWQVHELSFPSLSNIYEAVPLLIDRINYVLGDPSLDEDEKWLYREKEDALLPLKVSFMVFEDQDGNTTCLTYDQAFSIRALSVGDGVIAVRLGKMSKDIYRRYYAAKSTHPRDMPPVPEEIVAGYLSPCDEGFELDSIFLDGWDCRQQFEAAMAIRGFSTKAYNTIYFLGNYSDEYRRQLVDKLIREHGMQGDVRKQLLDYNP